jgi:hypothetical protein
VLFFLAVLTSIGDKLVNEIASDMAPRKLKWNHWMKKQEILYYLNVTQFRKKKYAWGSPLNFGYSFNRMGFKRNTKRTKKLWAECALKKRTGWSRSRRREPNKCSCELHLGWYDQYCAHETILRERPVLVYSLRMREANGQMPFAIDEIFLCFRILFWPFLIFCLARPTHWLRVWMTVAPLPFLGI